VLKIKEPKNLERGVCGVLKKKKIIKEIKHSK